ncbi:FAD-binding protein, partial [Candidatus Bipolaricaulota bacterium]|nr:FAD-binding protein [Candidatus Bipolaricaulota bacterium]
GDTPWPEFEAKALRSYPDWKAKGVDFSGVARNLRDGEGVEVAGAAEYFEGGVWVDESFASSIPGLYAAGECAVSLFGANRVAAATMEMLVSGAIAGEAAGAFSKANASPSPDNRMAEQIIESLEQPLHRSKKVQVGHARHELQLEASKYLGPVRCASELETLIRILDEIRTTVIPNLGVSTTSRTYNKEWIECLELANLVTVLELSARGALERRESRGVHYREDFPLTDNDQWLREIHFSTSEEKPKLSYRPVRSTSLSLPSGKKPYQEMIHDMMCAHSDVGGHH